MSAGMITGTASNAELPEDDTILELTGGENPLTFLGMNEETVVGLIAWMGDPDRIEGWRRAESNYVESDREKVLEALERQRLCLERGDDLPIYHPIHERHDPELDPLEDDAEDEPETEEHATPTAHEKHPDAMGIDVGQVLEIDRGETTEFVWPARDTEDEPYILQEYSGADELRQEMTLAADEIYGRLEFDPERRSAEDLNVNVPTAAAINRGESA